MSKAQEIRRFLAELSPADLADVPLRVLTDEEYAENMSAGGLHGLFVADATAVCDDAREGEVAILLNCTAIELAVLHEGDPWLHILSAAVHEFAHAIADGYTPIKTCGLDGDAARERVSAYVAAVDAPEWPDHIPPFHGHDETWIRACLHLAYRAEQIGWTFDLSRLMPIHELGLTAAESYQRMLGNQPARLSSMSVRDVITGTAAPKHFTSLWKIDVENWLMSATEDLPPVERDTFLELASASL